MSLITQFLNDFHWRNRKTIFWVCGVWAAAVIAGIGWLIAMI
jgi:hypothetical protein